MTDGVVGSDGGGGFAFTILYKVLDRGIPFLLFTSTCLLFQREWGPADDLFQSMCQPRGPVRPNASTFGIMIGAHLARDQPHKVRGEGAAGGGAACKDAADPYEDELLLLWHQPLRPRHQGVALLSSRTNHCLHK